MRELNETVYKHGFVHYGKNLPKAVQVPWEQSTGFWWNDLKEYIEEHKDIKDWREAIKQGLMPLYLSDFLHHEDGSINTFDFK